MNIFKAYATLGVSRGSTPEEIKASYRSLCMKYHPDRPEYDTDKFLEVQQAWNLLCTSEARFKHLGMMSTLGVECSSCRGRGVKLKQRSFTVVMKQPCLDCGGCGYKERA